MVKSEHKEPLEYPRAEKLQQFEGQSPQNCTVRQCVTSKFDIKNFSNSSKLALLHSRNMASL